MSAPQVSSANSPYGLIIVKWDVLKESCWDEKVVQSGQSQGKDKNWKNFISDDGWAKGELGHRASLESLCIKLMPENGKKKAKVIPKDQRILPLALL